MQPSGQVAGLLSAITDEVPAAASDMADPPRFITEHPQHPPKVGTHGTPRRSRRPYRGPGLTDNQQTRGQRATHAPKKYPVRRPTRRPSPWTRRPMATPGAGSLGPTPRHPHLPRQQPLRRERAGRRGGAPNARRPFPSCPMGRQHPPVVLGDSSVTRNRMNWRTRSADVITTSTNIHRRAWRRLRRRRPDVADDWALPLGCPQAR